MSESNNEAGDERVLVQLLVHKRFRNMSATLQRCYLLIRETVRVAIAAAACWAAFKALTPGLAAALALGILWLLAEPWLGRDLPGTSRVVLTDAGIYIIERGLACEWEDVVSHQVQGNRVVFEVSPEAFTGPARRKRFSLPLGRGSRDRILALFEGAKRGTRGAGAQS